LQSFLALAIVIYTALQLSNVDVTVENGTSESFCALGTKGLTVGDLSTDDIASSNCLFLEILGGLTIAIGFIIGIIQCFTCHLCGLGGILDLIFAILGFGAWLAASIIVTDVYNDTKAEGPDAPYNDNRKTIMIMCWVECALFATIILFAIMKCCSSRKSRKSGDV
jgi:hypothetical protein